LDMKLRDKPELLEYCWTANEVEYKFVPVLGRLLVDGRNVHLTVAESYVLGSICTMFPAAYKDSLSHNVDKVVICRIRKLTDFSILKTIRGYGWTLNCESISINNL